MKMNFLNIRLGRSKRRGIWKNLAIIFLLTIICTLTFAWYTLTDSFFNAFRHQLYCFELEGNKLTELKQNEPKLGQAIYFHETSCQKNYSDISLNARQSCSVESALRAHPDTDVFLLITSSVLKPLEDTENIFILQLLKYKNFKIRHIKFSKYLLNTPLNEIYKSGALNSSLWPVHHTSDILRYATLYKFGGIYLDLDVIVLKPLTSLKNFAGTESNTSLGSGILGFSFDKVGRKVAKYCVNELARGYNASVWGFNGPGVITRVMEKMCKTSKIEAMANSDCGGFKIYPMEYFQAISFRNSHLIFEEGDTEKIMKMFEKSYTIHYWNKMSSDIQVNNNTDVPFLRYAQKYCPKIYKAAKGNFN